MKFINLLLFICILASATAFGDNTTKIVNIKGGSLEYIDIGNGEFTIVIESGVGTGTGYWQPLLGMLRTLNQRVIIYSRAGIGRSTDNSDVTLQSSNKRLRALLHALNIKNNVILIGHSFGGLHARQYAFTFSEQVKGLILLDPSHEAFLAELNKLNLEWSQRDNQQLNKMMYQNAEWSILQKLYASSTMLDKGKVSSVPTVVVSSSMEGESDWWIGHSKSGKAVWRNLHASLIADNPNSVHIVSNTVSHNMPLDDPNLIVSSIMLLVNMLDDK
ncbi:alpha/beta fold hydrolase [Pseudoalteromonas luteoviolacea]|uniref:alpha/beta fold hydrolase n=1 Tax=Pseudoalteromonas luteoviolacea TaxID=43657 RepID=UPI0018C86ADC|nr:alpha/beta hydrolase [Pseudoalteromonas luteoviolacea]